MHIRTPNYINFFTIVPLGRHMTEAHSFFIPDPEYLADISGLLEYLGAKVGTSQRKFFYCFIWRGGTVCSSVS